MKASSFCQNDSEFGVGHRCSSTPNNTHQLDKDDPTPPEEDHHDETLYGLRHFSSNHFLHHCGPSACPRSHG
ncbi:hypothetical protein Y1Q_0020360 [Alligator mississippiensis]|uniref:Uncharacterized protein n=1 Tax=Alligator mississippiensis TaxID=8496 RepID=A0A151N6E7_ALLMI|nr:hypothetical protein Y1Q_0020360 [Alligator mississippiensis]